MTDKQIAELRALYSALHESIHAPFMAYVKAKDKSDTVKICYTTYETALSGLLNVIDREVFNDNLTKLKAKESAE